MSGSLAHGDFGVSLSSQQKVLTEFLTLFPATLELSFFAMLFAVAVGVPAGALAAVKRGGFYDQALMTVSLFGYSMPIFWWGLLLIMFVSVRLGLAPRLGPDRPHQLFDFDQPTGFMTIDALLSDQKGAFLDALRHLILPAIVLGTVPLAVIARMTRSSMLEVLSEDYVRTARAKGLRRRRVIGVHALRNALLPVVTVIGLSVSGLMAGAVLTETIFSWPGVGNWLIESIGRRDYPALQGGVLLISAVVVLVNLIVDLVYGVDRSEDPPCPLTSPRSRRRSATNAAAVSPSLRRSPRSGPRSGRTEARSSASPCSAVIVLLALTANIVAPHSPIEQFRDAVRAPPVWEAGGSWRFPLGTDGDGHDMLSRLIFGARMSLFIGLSVMGVSFVVGVALGLAAAMAGPVVDVADHPAHGSDHGGAEPRARRARRRGSGAEPRQHHHRRDHRLSAGLRASGARLRARRTRQGLRDRGAGGRRRAAAARLFDRAAQLPRPPHRAGGARRVERDSRGGGARLPRPWRPAADAGMGRDAGRFARIHSLRSLDRRPSGPRHSHHRRSPSI